MICQRKPASFNRSKDRFISLFPLGDGNLFDRKRGFSAHSLSLSSSLCHRPDVTEILLKKNLKRSSSIQPSYHGEPSIREDISC